MNFDDEELINLIHKREILWNNVLTGYKNKHIKNILYKEIAECLDSDRKFLLIIINK